MRIIHLAKPQNINRSTIDIYLASRISALPVATCDFRRLQLRLRSKLAVGLENMAGQRLTRPTEPTERGSRFGLRVSERRIVALVALVGWSELALGPFSNSNAQKMLPIGQKVAKIATRLRNTRFVVGVFVPVSVSVSVSVLA